MPIKTVLEFLAFSLALLIKLFLRIVAANWVIWIPDKAIKKAIKGWINKTAKFKIDGEAIRKRNKKPRKIIVQRKIKIFLNDLAGNLGNLR